MADTFEHVPQVWTAGQLRQALDGLPDDTPIYLDIAEDPGDFDGSRDGVLVDAYHEEVRWPSTDDEPERYESEKAITLSADWKPGTYDQAADHQTPDTEGAHGESGLTGTVHGNAFSKVDGLAAVLEPLPESLKQISRALRHLEGAQMIQMAGGGVPGEPVSALLRALLNAQQATAVAHGHLREAADLLSTMRGYLINDDIEDAGTTA
ncbi:DUF6225 family protein [Streptomyces sp. NPDC048445]|uniref:DUF6225 family protein n=1 Tax=Streptomyces sp. NPDC048445 TaxID=3365553 RepID=UPI0037147197